MANTVTQTDFQRHVVESTVPTLVDFWAPWCPPCRQQLPIVEEIDRVSGGRYKVVKVNVDDEPELAARYDIQSLPTLLVFRDGEPVSRLVGLQPKARILPLLESSEPSNR